MAHNSYNRVILMGNITADPELRFANSGTAICSPSLAINDRVKRGGEYVDEVSFVRLTIFGRTAEIVNEYCKKGSSILVEGRLRQESWEKDGQKRSEIVVVVDKLNLVGGRPSGDRQESTGSQPQQSRQAVTSVAEEEIPF